MELTLKNYTTTLSPDLILQAKKNKVRECDEIEKGHFVAYVDDANESFDVSLTIKAANEIIGHTCECNSNGFFCRHKAALIIHIAKGKEIKAPVKVSKKTSKVDDLLENADQVQLKEWIKGLIRKNKDIELSFIHHFSAKELLTSEEVIKIINDAIRAVIGNKKTIDLTQLKKLVELWSEMLKPIILHYHENVINEKSFLNFHTVLETCIDFQFKVFTTSNRVPKFIESTLKSSVAPINNLQVEEAWDKAVGYFINYVPEGKNSIRVHYLDHLKNIISTSNEVQKTKVIDLLVKQFQKSKPDMLTNGLAYNKLIFEIVTDYNLFSKYGQLFKPLRFDNEYNKTLIRLLIDNNSLDQAKKFCFEQIQHNFRDEYNVLYLNFLKEIFLAQKKEEELAKILIALLPFTFDFDDYLFILKRLPEEERKKWRTKMLSKSRKPSYLYKNEAIEFHFKLAQTEKNYSKMIDYIEHDTPHNIILKYFESMVTIDRNKLLERVLDKTDSYSWSIKDHDEENDAVYFSQLFKLLEKHYTSNQLKNAINNTEKNRRYSRSNKLIEYIKQQLRK